MSLTRASSFTAFACALAMSSQVEAHAPAKLMQFLSTKPDDVVLATNRGIIFGNLMTRDFKMLCNAAYHVSPAEETVRVARTDNGRLVVASSDGLQFSDDKGCTWQPAPNLEGVYATAMVQHPADAKQLYFATYTSSGTPKVATLRVSKDGGDTNSTLVTLGDEFVNSMAVVGTEPVQLYFVALTLSGMTVTELVARSTDGGKTWERTPIALEMGERNAKLLAVNPAKPEEILIRATGPEPSQAQRLLYSADGGKTQQSLGTVLGLEAAVFSRDGSVAYVAGLDGVQLVSGSAGQRKLEAPTTSARISQVEELDGELLAGGYYQGLDANKDGVGIGPTSSLAFQPWMAFTEVDEEVQCSAEVTKACKMLWVDWQLENPPAGGVPGASDAGTTADAATILDAGKDAGTASGHDAAVKRDDDEDDDDDEADGGRPGSGDTASADDGCACSTTSTGGLKRAWPWLLGLAFVARRRRAKPRGTRKASNVH